MRRSSTYYLRKSWEGTMRMKNLLVSAGLAVALFHSAGLLPAQAQTPGVLTGHVSSAEEGAMEGVLVSAKKAGSTITVTVASDKEGRYSFPAARLEPGQYAVSIRAVGYDIDGRPSAEVASGKSA